MSAPTRARADAVVNVLLAAGCTAWLLTAVTVIAPDLLPGPTPDVAVATASAVIEPCEVSP